MNAREELALVLANAQRFRNGSSMLPSAAHVSRLALDDADAVLAAGYSKPKVIGYAVLDRAGHMIGEQFTERNAAFEFAAEWTKDCEDAGIDWDYRVATITEAAA